MKHLPVMIALMLVGCVAEAGPQALLPDLKTLDVKTVTAAWLDVCNAKQFRKGGWVEARAGRYCIRPVDEVGFPPDFPAGTTVRLTRSLFERPGHYCFIEARIPRGYAVGTALIEFNDIKALLGHDPRRTYRIYWCATDGAQQLVAADS